MHAEVIIAVTRSGALRCNINIAAKAVNKDEKAMYRNTKWNWNYSPNSSKTDKRRLARAVCGRHFFQNAKPVKHDGQSAEP